MLISIFLILSKLFFGIKSHLPADLDCDFDISFDCSWSIEGDYTRATNMDGSFDSADSERFILFKASNNLSSFNNQHSFILATLKSELLMLNEINNTGQCSLNLTFKMKHFERGDVKIVRQAQNKSKPETELKIISGTDDERWIEKKVLIGNTNHPFNLLIEITFADIREYNVNQLPSFALRKIKFNNCKEEYNSMDDANCAFKCSVNQACISRDQICNIVWNCRGGEDELQDCDQLPVGAYCRFDDPSDTCGWQKTNNESKLTIKDGFLHIQFTPKAKFGDRILIKSPEFLPLPLYNSLDSSRYFQSCRLRFSYLLSETRSLSIGVFGIKKDPRYHNGEIFSISNQLYQSERNKASTWRHTQILLPAQIKYNFSIFIEIIKNLGKDLTASIDNLTLSKECFGLGVPLSEPRVNLEKAHPTSMAPTDLNLRIPSSTNLTRYTFTNCNAKGRSGPTLIDCQKAYVNTSLYFIRVNSFNKSFPVSQVWSVPKTGTYSLFAKGARGGHGEHSKGGYGSLVSAVFIFSEAETIFVTVGQSGDDACNTNTNNCLRTGDKSDKNEAIARNGIGGGGGGGGGTFLFKFDRDKNQAIPLLIAGGGGGGGGGNVASFESDQNNQANGKNSKGIIDGFEPGDVKGLAGGGGWSGMSTLPSQGHSLLKDALGGLSCSAKPNVLANGGFGGGGGGGCSFGGGGGGYVGGESSDIRGISTGGGSGGTSFVNKNLGSLRLFRQLTDQDDEIDNGLVVAFYQINNCCNNGEYPCAVLGERVNKQNQTELIKTCICPYEFSWPHCKNVVYKLPKYESEQSVQILIVIACLLIFLTFFASIGLFFFKCKRKLLAHNNNVTRHYCVGSDASTSHLLSNSSTEMQLSRIRNGRGIVTEFNPNYEFGGSICTLQDLREIQRDKLTLVKPLGQGAFGEVYQGFLINSDSNGETSEISVAVKTMPDFTSFNLFQMDFLMEALIMSKFKHRNIVTFIGVCFEKAPCFIVLELLAGGDLKNFLHDSRGTMTDPSPLNMGDLLVIALDVARGCQYLEENHFIHRDIAARNCLLTVRNKSPNTTPAITDGVFNIDNYNNGFNNSGIVVKIADFGMARDIYRADYYRKGGKAMLPVKWMPPEAFLDGMFSSKTDVWSFGVLLWEVMSMGFMPYPGRGNQEVMQYVTAGKRLEPPNRVTPPQVYAIMFQCWHNQSEMRPNFSTIIERLGYCLVDPDVLNKPLPIFIRLNSSEAETNQSRQSGESSVYLLPNGHSVSNSSYCILADSSKPTLPNGNATLPSDDSSRLMYILEEKNAEGTNEESPILLTRHLNNHQLSEKLESDFSQTDQVILNPKALYNRTFTKRYINVHTNDTTKA